MSWNDPITIGKTTESQYALDTKIVYCITSYNDEYNEMTVKKFADDFKEKLHEANFEWKHKKKDGTPRYPSYRQIITVLNISMQNIRFKQKDWI